jgi:hypothetical protein
MPHILKQAWKKWKAFAKVIARFQARVILTIFYFTFFAPFGLIVSLTKDELHIKNPKKTIWRKKEKQSQTIEQMRRQF